MIVPKPQHVNFWTAGEQGPEGWYYEDIDGKQIGPYPTDIDCYVSCGAYARNLDWEFGKPEGRLDRYKKASKESL
jgi:hypothetical protein